MRRPSDTLSPSFTLRSVTVPAAGDGTSIVALSDSSEMIGSSALTLSPDFTNTSMIGISLKSPMSGTLTSTVVVMVVSLSDQHAAHVREQAGEMAVEPRGGGAVDDAVIPGERQRQHEAPRRSLAIRRYLFPEGTAHPHDRDFGRIDDRCEVDAADPAEARDRETAALHLIGLELAVAGELGEIDHLFGDFDDAFLVRIAH